MVPAGAPVDQMIAALRPLLDPDDLIIDCGNANFHDTRRRAAEAAALGSPYLGIGVSGGEEGARHGPSIMGGGPKPAWDRVAPILEAIAARFDDTPCATWMGPDGAGHFVKTVHNGIEYADMQMIAEIYGIMRDGLGIERRRRSPRSSSAGTQGPLKSYLIEITGIVARATDPDTGRPVIDVILDRAGQKGTGRWTAIEAQHLGAPADHHRGGGRRAQPLLPPRRARRPARRSSARPRRASRGRRRSLDRLEPALLAGKIACYAQGFGLLAAASAEFGWSLPMPGIARVWRAGCIIRSAMLDDMARALEPTTRRQPDVRAALRRAARGEPRRACAPSSPQAALAGIPTPALAAALGYFDMMRTRALHRQPAAGPARLLRRARLRAHRPARRPPRPLGQPRAAAGRGGAPPDRDASL